MTTPSPSPTPKKTPDSTAKPADELLKADHREVDQLFSQFKSAKARVKRRELIEQIATALTVHTMIEEEIFYPACREKDVEDDDLDEAQVEHDTLKLLIHDLIEGSVDNEYYDAKVTVLSEYVKHHVGEEEEPSDGLFAKAKKAGVDMDGLGEKLQARKDALMADKRRLLARPPKIRSLNITPQTETNDMSRYPNDRYRDDENRNGGYRTGSGYGRNQQDDYRGGLSDNRGGRMSGYRGDYDDNHRDTSADRTTGGYGHGYTGRYGRDDERQDYDRQGYRGQGFGDSGYGAQRDDYQRDDHGPSHRVFEQSGSGGRYRTVYGDDDRNRGHADDFRSGSSRGYRFREDGEDERHDPYGRDRHASDRNREHDDGNGHRGDYGHGARDAASAARYGNYGGGYRGSR